MKHRLERRQPERQNVIELICIDDCCKNRQKYELLINWPLRRCKKHKREKRCQWATWHSTDKCKFYTNRKCKVPLSNLNRRLPLLRSNLNRSLWSHLRSNIKKWKSLYIQRAILNIADTTLKNLIFEKSTYAAAI